MAALVGAIRRAPQRRIASLLLNLALLLEWLAGRAAAVAIYGLLDREFASSSDLCVQRTVAEAMMNRGLALGRLGRCEDGMAVYDRLVELFGHSAHRELRVRVAWAMVNKGYLLQQLGRDREAVALYEQVHHRFAHSPEAKAAYVTGRRNMQLALSRIGRDSEASAIRRQLAALHASADQRSRSLGARTIPVAAAAVAAWAVDSGISLIVYHAIPQRHPSWLVYPLLYVDHEEHAQVMVRTPSRFLLVALIGMLALIVLRYTISLPLWVRIAFGVAFGGALANAVQYSAIGSVTDFLGVRGFGIWSAGDVSILLGLFTVAAGGIARPEALALGLKRRHLLVVVLSFVVAATVISGSLVWMKWAALVYAVGLLGALAPGAFSMTGHYIRGRTG